MTLAFRAAAVAAALLAAWGFGHLNGPVRLAGPFNFPDPLPPLAVVAALALAAVAARRSGWGARPFGILLVAAAGLVAIAGVVNQAGISPDGGAWGDRYVPAEAAWRIALYVVAAAMAAIGVVLARRAAR